MARAAQTSNFGTPLIAAMMRTDWPIVAITCEKDDFRLVIPQRFFIHGQNAQGDKHIYASVPASFQERWLSSSSNRFGR
jgi:hypothetical protein